MPVSGYGTNSLRARALQLTFSSHRIAAKRPVRAGTKVLAGSNPVTSTLAYLLTRQILLPMFSIRERSPRGQFRYVRKPGSESSPAFLFYQFAEGPASPTER